jgi:predicted ATP-binding protein involved in virulence
MFVRELTIRNLRAIKDLRLSFETPDGGTRKWTLLLGENGNGKSTILRAAALVFAGSDALSPLLREGADTWIRHGADEASIAAVIQTAAGETRQVSLRLRRGVSTIAIFTDNQESLNLLDAAIKHADRNYSTFGYGASRRLNTDESAFRKSTLPNRARAVATLFFPDAVLEPLESWVIDMDYRNKLGQGQETVRTIARELMPNVEFDSIDKERKQLLFKTPDGITPLSQLSDGYQNVAAWCGDLLRSINSTFKDYKDPLQARGLLLVDEIDLHLHPVWQRRLRTFFDRAFPNLQFIATTHSPLTVQQAGAGELFVVRRAGPKAPPTIEAFEGTPNTMMIHQLLLSPIFNLESMDSYEVQTKRKRYQALKRKKKAALSAPEKEQLQELKTSIEDLPDMAAGLARHEQKQASVLREIQAALTKRRRK